MTAYRWLHVTDLHFGMPGQDSLWQNMESLFFGDLGFLRTQLGAWDLVLFTGDLTQGGTAPEFEALERLLRKLWSRFADWGFEPQLLAIPGNHDLAWPNEQTDPTLVTLLHNWDLPAVQGPFWSSPDSPQRRLIADAFRSFADWWDRTSIPKPDDIRAGLLPGD